MSSSASLPTLADPCFALPSFSLERFMMFLPIFLPLAFS